MFFFINASNLKSGGGLQVADSICYELCKFPQHQFICVLSTPLLNIRHKLSNYNNIKFFEYNIKNNLKTIIWGRDSFLDKLVKDEKIDAVLTIFGPSRWNPNVNHLSGYAMPHLVFPSSPFFKKMGILDKIRYWIYYDIVVKYMFKRSTSYFWTENPLVSKNLLKLFPKSTVYSTTNYYNQIFEMPQNWVRKELPPFKGITLLTITSHYPHKNLEIALDICKYFKIKYNSINIRFVFTINDVDFPQIPEEFKLNFLLIGKVDIKECPSLYKQADIMFLPSLLECFSATYPEAMKMEVPIVTTDLEFAHGLCGDAACYYDAINPEAAADAIYKVATDEEYAQKLVENGKKQLLKFDNYEQRAEKLIKILEKLAQK